MTNWFNRWLVALIILIGVPFWWLLIDNDRGGSPAKPVHIVDLRKLAAIIPGERPGAVTETLLATRLSVGDFVAAGIGLKRRPLALITWSLPVPGQGPIIIDPAIFPGPGTDQFAHLNSARLGLVNAETNIASLILQTQGHVSAAQLLSNATQGSYLVGPNAALVTLQSRAAVTRSAQPGSFTTAQAVAPGVVTIPTPGHAPDTRLIFVQLADGREFLFVGDIAALSENWFEFRLRSHLAALWGAPQDDDETCAWLRTIRQLHAEAPHMQIVPGHDYLWLTSHLADRTITESPHMALQPYEPANLRQDNDRYWP